MPRFAAATRCANCPMQDWVDPFLEAMCDRGAQGLVLTSGAPPVLRFPNSEQPVSRQTLAAEHLTLLLSHAGGPELWREMQARGTATWTEDRPGRRYRFVARGDDGRPLRIDVTSEDPNAPPPVTPEAPPGSRPAAAQTFGLSAWKELPATL